MKKKLDFQTDDSKRDTPTIWIKTNQHTRLEFIFDEDGQDLWFSVDDLEIDPRSEAIKGMFFAFGKDFVCMADLISRAREFFQESLEEIKTIERDQRAHEAYLSSPRMTDRI